MGAGDAEAREFGDGGRPVGDGAARAVRGKVLGHGRHLGEVVPGHRVLLADLLHQQVTICLEEKKETLLKI